MVPSEGELREALSLLDRGCCGKQKIPVSALADLLHLKPPMYHQTSVGLIYPNSGPRSFAVFALETLRGMPYGGGEDPISDLRGLVAERLGVVD